MGELGKWGAFVLEWSAWVLSVQALWLCSFRMSNGPSEQVCLASSLTPTHINTKHPSNGDSWSALFLSFGVLRSLIEILIIIKYTYDFTLKERLVLSCWILQNYETVCPNLGQWWKRRNMPIYHLGIERSTRVPTSLFRIWGCTVALRLHASAGCPRCLFGLLSGQAFVCLHQARPTLVGLC